jgi:hypothetical protein
MGNAFATGMQLGTSAYQNAQQNRRQEELDTQNRWRFDQEQAAAGRQQRDRSDLDTIAQGYNPGAAVTPNMTRPGPGGMGPVADPADLGSKMDPSQTQAALGQIMLRQGNVAGYNDTTERARMLQRRAASEEFGKHIATATDEELFQSLAGKINNNPNVPLMLGYDPNTHTAVVTKPSGETMRLSPAELRQHAAAIFHMGQGDFDQGLNQMLAAEQSQQGRINGAADRGTKLAEGQSKIYHDTTAADASKTTAGAAVTNANAHMASVAEQGRHDRAMEGHAAAANKASHIPLNGQLIGPDGEPIMGFMTMDPKTGQVTVNQAQLPQGVKLAKTPRPELSNHDLADMAKQIMGTQNPVTKKPYTMQEAMAEARAGFENKGGPGVDVDLEKLKAALQGGGKGGGVKVPAGNPQRIMAQPGARSAYDSLAAEQDAQSQAAGNALGMRINAQQRNQGMTHQGR